MLESMWWINKSEPEIRIEYEKTVIVLLMKEYLRKRIN